ncbi:melanocortin-2 receptor accessory protein 2A-like [Alosa alosa]|uniref:melanocortin-2 receptor accessory protein 2A-like n=1 Tax=Alosa sapidissima TaxID=34773 RepID=UPI001C0A2614|nr:melanocortin-2 receptor accessory protein 2A-like [Alosa sapidissima]XP_048106996.1 melanocortin-2 receptor accessory protein 2A-like [Alosa alosa]
MSVLLNNTQNGVSFRGGDNYVWQYEYYDDEEPVSFEGLKAHRYSIVIGFWVGLAVFVIFMFFVLTLLTKTGAPHQEHSEGFVKSVRVGTCVVDMGTQAFCRPLLANSHSPPFRCWSQDQTANQMPDVIALGKLIGCNPDGVVSDGDLLSEFNIPNVVVTSNPELNVTDDDLLLSEPPVIIEDQSHGTTRAHTFH